MFKRYLNSQFKTRIITATILVALTGLYAFLYNPNVLPIVGIIAAIAALVEVFIFHRKALIVTLITIIHLILQALLTYSTYLAFNIYELDALPLIITIMATLGLLSTIIAVWWSGAHANGKMWVTLLLAITAYYTGFVLATTLVPQVPVLFPVGALLLMLVVLTLRTVFPRPKQKNLTLAKVPTTQSGSVLQHTLDKKYNKTGENKNVVFLEPETGKQYFFACSRYAFMAILPIDPENDFSANKNKLQLDGEDVTDILEAFLNDLKKYSHTHKLPVKHITPVVYVRRKNHLGTELAEVEVFPRHAPEKALGSVFVTTPEGYTMLLNRFKNSKKPLPKKILTHIETVTSEPEDTTAGGVTD